MPESGAAPSPLVPAELRTARLRLRPWAPADAAALHPVLAAEHAHLGPWIPAHVADPATVPALAGRLAGWAADFAAARSWRWAILAAADAALLGEVSLFPRSAAGRVALAEADRAEVGYWLRAAATGQGLATEAVRAVLAAADALPSLAHVEIRCDARNAPSAALPRRLGFTLADTREEPSPAPGAPPIALQRWVRPRLAPPPPPTPSVPC